MTLTFFATNIISPSPDAGFAAARIDIPRKVLAQLGVLP